jgi:nitroreductase
MAAPSATNRRPWEFVVITDPETLAGLRQRLILGRYNPSAAIVVCGNLRRSLGGAQQGFWVQDCSAATQNILLAATGLGLGSVWIGVHPIAPFSLLVSRWLHLPKHVRPLGVVYLGYPDEIKEPRSQYDAKRVHWQRFGSDEA